MNPGADIGRIEFRDLTFGYGDGTALFERLSVTLDPGSFVVLIGPSGCGKSTLLRLAAGFLLPRSGSVLFSGQAVRRPDRQRLLIYQEQDQLFPWLRLLGNTALPLVWGPEACSRPEAEARARAALVQVGLGDRLDAFPHQLSGGMKQRAVLARALAVRAPLLLLDEPFASLDALSREGLQELLVQSWRQYGSSVLFVTHDLREALRMGAEIWFMHPGRDVGGAGGIERILPPGTALRDLDTPEALALLRDLRRRFELGTA